MRERTDREDIGVEEYYLLVLGEAKYMQLCKDSVEIRATYEAGDQRRHIRRGISEPKGSTVASQLDRRVKARRV